MSNVAKRSFRKFVISKDRQIEGIVLEDAPHQLTPSTVITAAVVGQQRSIPTVKKHSAETAKKDEPPLGELGPPSFLETLKQLGPYAFTPPKDPKAALNESVEEPESFLQSASGGPDREAESAYQLGTAVKMTPARELGGSPGGGKVYRRHTGSVIKLVRADETEAAPPNGTLELYAASSGSARSPKAPANPQTPDQERPEDVHSSVGSRSLVTELLNRQKATK